MQNKKLAKSLIQSIFAPQNNTPTSTVYHRKKSYLIPFEGEVTKRFMKIASSTYVDLSDPDRVWRFEILEGKPYIVALEKSNILRAEDYDVHDAVQGVMLYKGDRVIANIPLPPTADAKAIALRLKERVASLNHLPPQLIVEIMTKEASSLANTFINMKEYQIKTAEKKNPAEKPSDSSVSPDFIREKAKHLEKEIDNAKLEIPKDIASRFQSLILRLKDDSKTISRIQHIVDSYDYYIRKLRHGTPAEKKFIMYNMGESEGDVDEHLSEQQVGKNKSNKKSSSKLFIPRLITSATQSKPSEESSGEPPIVNEFRTLFADVFTTMGNAYASIMQIIGYVKESSDLIYNITRGGGKGSAVSLQEHLIGMLVNLKENAQDAYTVVKHEVYNKLANTAEKMQQQVNAAFKGEASLTEILTMLNNILPELKVAEEYVLKIAFQQHTNTKVQNFINTALTKFKSYLIRTRQLFEASTDLYNALSVSYRISSTIFINLRNTTGASIGNPINLKNISKKDTGSKMSRSSDELSDLDSLIRVAEIAKDILNSESAGQLGLGARKLKLYKNDLESVITNLKKIFTLLADRIAKGIPPPVAFKQIVITDRKTIEKIYNVLIDVLPLASFAQPERLTSQVVQGLLTNFLPLFVDITLHKAKSLSLLHFIKLSEDNSSSLDSLISDFRNAFSNLIIQIRKFYEVWDQFKTETTLFLAIIEQGYKLFKDDKSKSESESKSIPEFIHNLLSPNREMVFVGASLKQILKTAENTDADDMSKIPPEADKWAAILVRHLQSKLSDVLHTMLPKEKVISALNQIGISNAGDVIRSMPTKMYWHFVTTLFGNLAEMFRLKETHEAKSSIEEGSNVETTVSPPESPSTYSQRAVSKLATLMGIPKLFISLLLSNDVVVNPKLLLKLDFSQETKDEIREQVELNRIPLSPESGFGGDQPLVFPVKKDVPIFVPDLSWETFKDLYPHIESVLDNLGKSLAERVVSLYAMTKNPKGNSILKSIRDIQIVTRLYFYNKHGETAEDVRKLGDQEILAALKKENITANPLLVKAIASMFFFYDKKQAEEVSKGWREYVEEIGKTESKPVQMLDNTIHLKAKKYFSNPANLDKFIDTLVNTGIYSFRSLNKHDENKTNTFRSALSEGRISEALGMFSGPSRTLIKEQLAKIIPEINLLDQENTSTGKGRKSKKQQGV